MQADGHVLFLKCLILLILSSAKLNPEFSWSWINPCNLQVTLQRCPKAQAKWISHDQGTELEGEQDLRKPCGCSERQNHELWFNLWIINGSALCRGAAVLSGSTEPWGEAQINASSTGALRGEAANRSTGSTRWAPNNCLCWKCRFQIPQNNSQEQGSFWLVVWWFLRHFWVSLLANDKSKEGQFRNTNDRMGYCPWVFKVCLFLNRKGSHVIFLIPEGKTPRFKSNFQQNYNPAVCFSVLFTSGTSGALLWSVAPTECLQHLHWGVNSWINLAQLGTSTIHMEFHKYDLANFQNTGWAFLHEELLLSPAGLHSREVPVISYSPFTFGSSAWKMKTGFA